MSEEVFTRNENAGGEFQCQTPTKRKLFQVEMPKALYYTVRV